MIEILNNIESELQSLGDLNPSIYEIFSVSFTLEKKIKFNNVSVHNNQSLVIVNLGEAQGIDIYKFSQKIKESVLKKFDILLEEEVNII